MTSTGLAMHTETSAEESDAARNVENESLFMPKVLIAISLN
jgi:hypothetical protein